MKSTSKSALEKDVLFYEYTSAANPLAKGVISSQPFGELLSELHETGPTRVIPFDLSEQLGTPGPATSANLMASFLRIEACGTIDLSINATSELYYVIRGNGHSALSDGTMIDWKSGDFFVIPGGHKSVHSAESDSALYWISDEPLLRFLGVQVAEARFAPTLYKAEDCHLELKKIAEDPKAVDRNRVSVLLANSNFPQTMTVTHTLWAMFGLLPVDAVQPPHRHNSVALDLILDCKPGCYSLVAKEIDSNGVLINPVRQDWKPYSAFVTPPFYWHSHHNESGAPANLIPIQDAGLHTHMRTLDIEFAHPTARANRV